MDTKIVGLEEVRSRLEVKEDEPTTMQNAQTKLAAELEQCRTQTAKRTSELVEVH